MDIGAWFEHHTYGIAIYLATFIVPPIVIAIWRPIARALLPLEARLLQRLQDRAMARALGKPVDAIRFRRKLEEASKE